MKKLLGIKWNKKIKKKTLSFFLAPFNILTNTCACCWWHAFKVKQFFVMLFLDFIVVSIKYTMPTSGEGEAEAKAAAVPASGERTTMSKI